MNITDSLMLTCRQNDNLDRIKHLLTAEGNPNLVFYKMVGISVAITMALGTFFFIKNQRKWEEEFKQK